MKLEQRYGRTVNYFAWALGLSVLMFVYYSTFHINWMDPYPKELKGAWAYLASLLISLPLVHIAKHILRSIGELPVLLQPRIGTLVIALIVFLLTPLGNFVGFPFAVGVWLGLWLGVHARLPSLSIGNIAIFIVLAVLAYLVTCLSKRSGVRPRGAREIIPLYLWTVYAGETLFFGVSYI